MYIYSVVMKVPVTSGGVVEPVTGVESPSPSPLQREVLS